MRYRLIIVGIFVVFSCNAQSLPLNTPLLNISQNAHIKDLNNELPLYVGIYKTSFQDKEITLFITKEEDEFMDYGRLKFYSDVLSVKYIVKKSTGEVLQDTQNNNNPDIEFFSTNVKSNQNSVTFYYGGTNCGVGWGDIFLKKINAVQILWEYIPDSTIIDSNKCPVGTDIKIYLPETKGLIFTKQ